MKQIIFIIFALVLSGCTMARTNDLLSDYDKIPSMQPYQAKAITLEKKDDLQLALANWRVAEKLLIDKINALTDHIGNNAEKHFQKGLTLFNSGFYELAGVEFVKTLRYDRGNQEALGYLKERLKPARHLLYEVNPGDTFSSIAESVYKNNEKAYIVEYFSGKSVGDELESGTTILLPVLDIGLTKLFFNLNREIILARKLFKTKNYEKLIVVIEDILRHEPLNREAIYMKNTACFRLGEKYFHDEKYQQALELLKRVDKYYRNVKNDIAEVKTAYDKKKNEAIEHQNNMLYHKGMLLFKNMEYQSALAIFANVDPGYANVEDIIANIKSEMTKMADLHYKNGIKYFLNEKLTLAIDEWQKALNLDPENKMIRRDIENSMKLLEKIKKMN